MKKLILFVLSVLIFALASFACGSNDNGGSQDSDSDSDSDTDTDTSTDSDTDVDSDTETHTDTDTDYDCSDLPEGPFDYIVHTDIISWEDFAFDDQGYLLGMQEGGQESMFKTSYYGDSMLWSLTPGCKAGMRTLSDGSVVCAGASELFLIDETGSTSLMILGGLSYPNGIEIDLNDFVYVAEENAGSVRRVNPFTGDYTVLATDLHNPNGLSFNPSYDLLYVGSFGSGTVYTIEVNEDGEPGEVATLVDDLGTGFLDGLGVDICGNIYVCDWGGLVLYRITPDGTSVRQIATFWSDSGWIPNLQWGSGYGGWEEYHLFVIDIEHEIYEIELGVPSKIRNYP